MAAYMSLSVDSACRLPPRTRSVISAFCLSLSSTASTTSASITWSKCLRIRSSLPCT
jgi:hypothetical protein